ENRLVFTTVGGVQPRAQLIANPTRLVIDLPGTTIGRPTVNQTVGSGGIREIRVGQFDAQTTRIVVELSPGYTIDPQQVQVRGDTPSQWSSAVAPRPARSDPPTATLPTPTPPTTPTTPTTPAPNPNAATRIEGVRITGDGFFIRTSGATPQIQVNRSRDRRQMEINVANAGITSQVQTEQTINQFGVDRLQITPQANNVRHYAQPQTIPTPTGQATASNLGGIVVLPISGSVASRPGTTQPSNPSSGQPVTPPVTVPTTPQTRTAIVQAVELAPNGSQLLIRADAPIRSTSGFDSATASYRIVIPNARLADRVTPPVLPPTSPLQRVRLVQQDEQTVVILVQPASGTRIGELNQPSSQTIALAIQSSSQAIPVPPPVRPNPTPPPTTPTTPGTLPTIPNGRVVIVIDPGHGGPDPGAIGIGGLRETDIVLDISRQVGAILERQGVSVVMTRTSERNLELEPRVQIADRANADLFVSIHANAISMSRPDVNGIETYFYGSSASQRLAQAIQSSIIRNVGGVDRGVRSARFYVLRNTDMPAVLVETGFVTGRDDARNLADPAYRSRMAAAIAQGILQYVQQNNL
ncbi:MAG: N-acetylmuramoyl-L-alanine amidase, partial [Leptolyngbyaceae cyanobacterium SM1_3_5]|nr:N-acetylmuramoyl-L-alanine amidase [Leptolyngbyaceae cyanobacterium SM1_3_5]